MLSTVPSAASPDRPTANSLVPRSFTTTAAPWAPSDSAQARPIPFPAPVTRATRPCRGPPPALVTPRRLRRARGLAADGLAERADQTREEVARRRQFGRHRVDPEVGDPGLDERGDALHRPVEVDLA